jgi:hypothetical protein
MRHVKSNIINWKVIVSSIIIIGAYSCKNNSNPIITNFFNKNEDFIYLDFYPSNEKDLLGCYKLYRSGDCDYFLYTRGHKKRKKFGGFGDFKVIRKWALNKDSIYIMSENFSYKISADTLRLVSEYKNKKYSLWKSDYPAILSVE